MIFRQQLLSDLQRLLRTLEADLLERSESADLPEVGHALQTDYERTREAARTAQSYEEWRSDFITQMAAAWVLSCVFVRFLEDNRLIDPPKLSGPAERLARARDEHELFFRSNPKLNDRDYLLNVFSQLATMPGGKDVFGPHNPISELPNWLSGDAADEMLAFFQRIDPDTGSLIHDFTDPDWDTRFLGDLYQDLSEAARKKYALLQTPEFVEEFILDRTLDPAIAEFGLKGFRMIDPACGSGHFLLGTLPRLLDRWQKLEPATNVRELAQRALDAIHGVDVNPYAVAIARFRLLLMAMKACGVSRLADAPSFHINVICGDSLLHGSGEQISWGWSDVDHASFAEDLAELRRILVPGRYHAVVANPPYITPKDRALNQAYRERYGTCHMKYSLAVPFMERIFRLAVEGGFTGQITANSFMKREFGKKLIEQFLPSIDLTHVIDTSGAYIPGHGTPTVILFGRHHKPVAPTIRTVMGIRGEPSTPDDPARGLVWSAIVNQVDQPGSKSEFVSVGDSPRELFVRHPWSIGGGGAAELKDKLDASADSQLDSVVESIGPASFAGVDEAFVAPLGAYRRIGVPQHVIRLFAGGDQLRDWQSETVEECITPYSNDAEPLPLDKASGWARRLWAVRRTLESVTSFGGKTRKELGEPWWTWYRWIADRVQANPRIAFAFVATHNHFVLDRGRKVFNRSAPVLKLAASATEVEQLGLLGLLNSSIACFWMKQVFYPKASTSGDISTEKGKPEANRYEFAAAGLNAFPVPFAVGPPDGQLLCRISAQLDRASLDLASVLPHAILEGVASEGIARIGAALVLGRARYFAIRQRMNALQEELDWECYRLYGICDDGASKDIVEDELQGIPAEARPFLWHTDVPPHDVPEIWRETYALRRKLIGSIPELRIVEDVVFKRPWWGRQGVYGRLSRDYDGWTTEALACWLLDRLESYFDFDGRMNAEGKATAKVDVSLYSSARLADVAQQDRDFMQVGELYRDDPAFDVLSLVAELVEAESVPLLPVLRYKATGLRKRLEWETTWRLQRQEDAIDARTKLDEGDPLRLTEDEATAFKRREIGDIPVPPKYASADFLKSDYWRLRGKLDVPKERWVSFPHCEGPDGTLVVAWAGYDHLQLARAISGYYVEVQERLGGRDDPRLVPLLAGLIELLPWLKQWHNEPDAKFNGMRMGDYFEGFVQEEARQMSKTLDEIKAWQPPAGRPRGRQRSRA